ncbi:nucleotidyltransferase family protein [Rhodoferax sp. BAB1]|uniref:nucleotidyltransferase family protein n=1 Tax=Rhodoferax sp. BAB1 TaxID=2741720 RepID=UPI0015763E6C|nr:nucleotidyltransferase family protein [Rhodoferax sp. BAB1]QKO23962.1 nucleotidyltransferase family protein [Rhodoferax sp. BAB1]
MVLAAGRGERMRPLTDAIPKPLLAVQGKTLLQWHVDALADAGFADIVINTAWLGEQIPAYFGPLPHSSCGRALALEYSWESLDFGAALETAGGISRALPLLGDIFWVLAGDVYAPGFEFSRQAVQRFARSDKLAHLWLVPNPPHNPDGDFGLAPDPQAPGRQLALNQSAVQYTYSTIGLYRREFFARPWCEIPAGNPQGVKTPLAPLLRKAMDNQRISAELYTGAWTDVGTPERLAQLNASPARP